jgi:hypothetical protein
MLTFYIDEFGDTSLASDPSDAKLLKKGVSEKFILAAVGIRDSSRRPMAEAIFALKEKHLGATNTWAESEIKGRYLFRAARSAAAGKTLESPAAYAQLNTPEKVDAFVRDIGFLFSTFRPIIFSVVVDKARLIRRPVGQKHSPLGAAYAYLHQRIALTLEKVHPGEGAILVADQQTQHEKFFRSGQMNEEREYITNPLSVKPNFRLILDKPLWIDTDLSSWDREIIQLADIVAYSTNEWIDQAQPPPQSCYLWPQIRPHFAINWRTGEVASGGLAVYPRLNPMPDV